MKEVTGDIWQYHKQGLWIAITTNGVLDRNGDNVMGRGIALQAKRKYPGLPRVIGREIKKGGNRVHIIADYGVITFPVKHHWRDKADLALIEESARQLAGLSLATVYLVRPGCGSGGLEWSEVKPVLEKHLGDNYIVADREE